MAGLPAPKSASPRRLGRAISSRLALAAGAGGLITGTLVGAGAVTTLVMGAAAWSVPATLAVRRAGATPRRSRIDPFTLRDPWLSHVRSALTSRTKVHERVDSVTDGPLKERLLEIAERVDDAVDESWQIAQRGNAMAKAREAIDTSTINLQISELEKSLIETPDEPRLTSALDARRTQRSAAQRMDRLIGDTDNQLRLLGARMDEVVVRAAELSAQVGDDRLIASLSSDVDGLLTEMEALRQALDETHRTAGGLPASDPG